MVARFQPYATKIYGWIPSPVTLEGPVGKPKLLFEDIARV